MKTLSQLGWSASVAEIKETLANTTIFDKIEFSGISKAAIADKLHDLRTRQVPQRTVLLNADDDSVVEGWFKNWLHPSLKNAVKKSPANKRGCSREVIQRDMERDNLAFYENGQHNFNYTIADIDAWLQQ